MMRGDARRLAVGAAAVAGIALLAASCATQVTPAPAPTASPERAVELVVYYSQDPNEPIPVIVKGPALGDMAAGRIRARLDALAAAPRAGPYGSLNVAPLAPLLRTVMLRDDLATLDYAVGDRGWGLTAPGYVGAFVRQVVWTATQEPGVERVWFTQDGDERATIDGVTFHAPLTRSSVLLPRPAPGIVYLARDRGEPLAVSVAGAGEGATIADRVESRLRVLERGLEPPVADAFNVLAGMGARLSTVRIDADVATLDYTVPGDDWGLHGSATLRAFVEQIVFTTTEEPGIMLVLVTQNGGATAIVGGEGLVIDRPISRIELRRGLR